MTQAPQEIETMLLLDTTESMNWSSSETDPTPRKDVVGEAIGTIVEVLAAADSQAAKEAEAQEDEGQEEESKEEAQEEQEARASRWTRG